MSFFISLTRIIFRDSFCLYKSFDSMDDGAVRMYYTGQGKDGSTAIGVAKLSTASNEWVREQATFSFV
jgi:hypothetical protein